MLKKIIATLISLILLLTCGCYPFETPLAKNNLRVYFIDVGQADCALISLNGKNMLIDGGNVDDGPDVIRFIESLGITTLHTVVGTHAHEDHIGGLSAIIDAFDVENVYSPVDYYNSLCFTDFRSSALDKCGMILCERGMSWKIDTADVSVLWADFDNENTNNTSIVLKLVHGNVSFLFTGDIEAEAESAIVNNKDDISANILKVAHHGSDSSTTYMFLRSVMPQAAIISCGKDNTYGHPHQRTLNILEQAEATTYRTDLLSTVKVVSDGNNFTISASGTMDTYSAENNRPAFDMTYIGNAKSKKFHLSSCPGLPSKKNAIEFSSYEEAILKGYSPCGTCKP